MFFFQNVFLNNCGLALTPFSHHFSTAEMYSRLLRLRQFAPMSGWFTAHVTRLWTAQYTPRQESQSKLSQTSSVKLIKRTVTFTPSMWVVQSTKLQWCETVMLFIKVTAVFICNCVCSIFFIMGHFGMCIFHGWGLQQAIRKKNSAQIVRIKIKKNYMLQRSMSGYEPEQFARCMTGTVSIRFHCNKLCSQSPCSEPVSGLHNSKSGNCFTVSKIFGKKLDQESENENITIIHFIWPWGKSFMLGLWSKT